MRGLPLLILCLWLQPCLAVEDSSPDIQAQLTALREEIKAVKAQLAAARQDLGELQKSLTPETQAAYKAWLAARNAVRAEEMALRRERYRIRQDQELFARQVAREQARQEKARALAEQQANRPGQTRVRIMNDNPYRQNVTVVPFIRVRTNPLFYADPFFYRRQLNPWDAPLFHFNGGLNVSIVPFRPMPQ